MKRTLIIIAAIVIFILAMASIGGIYAFVYVFSTIVHWALGALIVTFLILLYLYIRRKL